MSEQFTFVCAKCGQTRDLLKDWNKWSAARGECIFCFREHNKIRMQNFRENNKDNSEYVKRRQEYSKKYNTKNKEKIMNNYKIHKDSPEFKNYYLKKYYGITLEEYNKIFELQNNKCAICKTSKPGHKRINSFFVDHDHKTKKFRGLLCNRCNIAIGQVDENTNILSAMTDYILSHKSYSDVPYAPGLPW